MNGSKYLRESLSEKMEMRGLGDQDPTATEIEKIAKSLGADTASGSGRIEVKPKGSDLVITAYYDLKPVSIEVSSKSQTLIRRNYGSVVKLVEDISRLIKTYDHVKENDILFSQAMGEIEKKIGRRWKFGKRVIGKLYTATRKGVTMEIEYSGDKLGGLVDIYVMWPGETRAKATVHQDATPKGLVRMLTTIEKSLPIE